jgi:hypothetical protein
LPPRSRLYRINPAKDDHFVDHVEDDRHNE